MIKGVTKSGFAFEVERAALEDMEVVELLAEHSENDPMLYQKLTGKLFGQEQKQRLYDHLKDEKGRIPFVEVVEAVNDVFVTFGSAGKNC